MPEHPQSDRAIGLQAEANSTWQTMVSKHFDWCRLKRTDLDEIRNAALKFIRQSATPEDARIDWLLTFPARQKATQAAKGSTRKKTSRISSPNRFLWELRATDTGHELLRDDKPSPGLDSMAEQIAERKGLVPRVFRHLEFTVTAPDYAFFMRVGGHSFRSPRTTIRFMAPEPGIPLEFHTISDRLSTCSNRFLLRRVIWVWMLAWILLVLPASLVIPYLYHGFQSDPNRDNVTAETVVLGLSYLIGVPIVIGASLAATAARITLSDRGRKERIIEGLLRPAREVNEIWRSIGRETKVLALIGLVGILVALLAWLRPL